MYEFRTHFRPAVFFQNGKTIRTSSKRFFLSSWPVEVLGSRKKSEIVEHCISSVRSFGLSWQPKGLSFLSKSSILCCSLLPTSREKGVMVCLAFFREISKRLPLFLTALALRYTASSGRPKQAPLALLRKAYVFVLRSRRVDGALPQSKADLNVVRLLRIGPFL